MSRTLISLGLSDIANLPFEGDVFEGVVSLHTIHHLPEEEHLQAYQGLFRVLAPGTTAAIVNGWKASRLMSWFSPLIRLSQRANNLVNRLQNEQNDSRRAIDDSKSNQKMKPKGTFTDRHEATWIKEVVGEDMPLEIRVWRSVSVRFLRTLIHPLLGGRYWLRFIYWLEERYPHYFGENGQYPLIVIRKPAQDSHVNAH